MKLEYKSPEFKGNDNDGLYIGFCDGEPAVMFRVSKESGIRFIKDYLAMRR